MTFEVTDKQCLCMTFSILDTEHMYLTHTDSQRHYHSNTVLVCKTILTKTNT